MSRLCFEQHSKLRNFIFIFVLLIAASQWKVEGGGGGRDGEESEATL